MSRIMEKYVPYIPSVEPYCTRSGKVPSEDVIPDGTDICWAYKFVDVLPDVGVFPHRICIPSTRIGSFQPGEVLTTETTASATKWVRLPTPTKGVGVPTEITCVAVPDDDTTHAVVLRWRDPKDEGKYVWKKTRVVRKYKDYPANENDGTVVIESTIRDQYWGQDDAFVDLLPNITGQVYYKVFAYSADGVVTTDITCNVQPQQPGWGSTMSQQIQRGLASMIFHIGDEITLTKGSDSFVFKVIGFDLFNPTSVDKPRSVALVSKTALSSLAFDKQHPTYVKVVDEIAPAKGTKIYFKKQGGVYVVISIPTGTHITSADNIYVKETDTEAIANGSNKWETSSSRTFLNGEGSGQFMRRLKTLDSDFTDMILETNDFLDNVANKVRLPTVEELETYDLTGWSMTPNAEDTFKLWYRYYSMGKYYTDLHAAKNTKNSYVIISIG